MRRLPVSDSMTISFYFTHLLLSNLFPSFYLMYKECFLTQTCFYLHINGKGHDGELCIGWRQNVSWVVIQGKVQSIRG
jgi:hypothetical protein